MATFRKWEKSWSSGIPKEEKNWRGGEGTGVSSGRRGIRVKGGETSGHEREEWGGGKKKATMPSQPKFKERERSPRKGRGEKRNPLNLYVVREL